MSAILKVYYDWGGAENSPGTAHNVTDNGSNAIRFKTEDDATIDTNNPIPIPSTGTNYSYWKQMYIECTDDTGLTKIDNLKIFSDGTIYGSGITLNVGDETPTKNSGSDAGYDLAVGTSGTTGTVMTGHTDVTAVTDFSTYVTGSPKSVSISEASSQIDAAGETSDYVVFQVAVASTATGGAQSAETITWRYDEI